MRKYVATVSGGKARSPRWVPSLFIRKDQDSGIAPRLAASTDPSE